MSFSIRCDPADLPTNHRDVYGVGECDCFICREWTKAYLRWDKEKTHESDLEFRAWDNVRNLYSEISHWAVAEGWEKSGWHAFVVGYINGKKKRAAYWSAKIDRLPMGFWIDMLDLEGLTERSS